MNLSYQEIYQKAWHGQKIIDMQNVLVDFMQLPIPDPANSIPAARAARFLKSMVLVTI